MPATAFDDRGREVPVYQPAMERSPLPSGLAAKLHRHGARLSARRFLEYGGAVAAFFGLLCTGFNASIVTSILVFLGCWAIGAGLSFVIFRITANFAADRTARLLALAGHCGSCGYVLDLQRREPDGCVACPECGACWRIVPSPPPPVHPPTAPGPLARAYSPVLGPFPRPAGRVVGGARTPPGP